VIVEVVDGSSAERFVLRWLARRLY
jgi:hypothetical protein